LCCVLEDHGPIPESPPRGPEVRTKALEDHGWRGEIIAPDSASGRWISGGRARLSDHPARASFPRAMLTALVGKLAESTGTPIRLKMRLSASHTEPALQRRLLARRRPLPALRRGLLARSEASLTAPRARLPSHPMSRAPRASPVAPPEPKLTFPAASVESPSSCTFRPRAPSGSRASPRGGAPRRAGR